MKLIICSKNPIKVLAAKTAFESHFKDIVAESLDLSSKIGVLKQPMSSEETLESAVKRIELAQEIKTADYYVSMEGGIANDKYGSFLTWYVCVADKKGEKSIAGGGRMPLPRTVFNELNANSELELGDVMDRITKEDNVKQKGGSTAVFTENRVQRADVFRRAILMALIPFTSEIYKHLANNN